MKKENDLVDVLDCLNRKYGLSITTLRYLPVGADMQALVYKANTQNGPSYFVKLKQGHHPEISVKLLAFLQASGIQQIIPPIQAIDGKLIQHIKDFTLTVYPFVDGQSGFYTNLTEDQWVSLGKTLKQLHELDAPPSIQEQIKKETYSPKWREAVRSLDASIERSLIGDEPALMLQAFMKAHRTIIQRLVHRAESLSQMLQKQAPEYVLCHSDIHAGNVLIDESGALYIVDWDEPIMAPRERDLMFIGGGVANVWNHPCEETFFYKGYGNTPINKVILAYYRHERIIVDIMEYGHALLLTSDGGEERLEMYKQFIGMFAPNGVIDIAFKTDEKLALEVEDRG